MPLKQRTVHYSLNGHKLLDASRDAFLGWAGRHKNVDLNAIGVHGELAPIGENTAAQFEEFQRDDLEGSRFIHEVTNKGGTYRTELTAVRRANEGWVQTDVHVPRDDARFATPAVPRFLLDAADSHNIRLLDGSMYNVYSPAPRTPKLDEIGQLLDDAVSNNNRTQSVIIAGSDDSGSLNQWRNFLEKTLHWSQGLATFWLLDPEATKEFNQLVLPEFQVYPFSLHYFAPGVDTAEPSDHRHHRYFSRRDITHDDRKFTGHRLYHLARSAALRTPLPDVLKQADDLLRKRSTERIVAALQPARPLRARIKQEGLFSRAELNLDDQLEIDLGSASEPAPSTRPTPKPQAQPFINEDPSVLQVQEELFDLSQETPEEEHAPESPAPSGKLKGTGDFKLANAITLLATEIGLSVDLDAIDEDFLTEVFAFAEQGMKAESIRNKLSSTRTELDEAQQEKDLAEALIEELYTELDDLDNEAAQERVRASNFWMKLQGSGHTETDWSDPTEDYPTVIKDVLARIGEFEYLNFTGDARIATNLDNRDNSTTIAKNCWNFFIALNSYAEQWDPTRSSVHMYLDNNVTPANPMHHAQGETRSVRETEKYNKERHLPVPHEVDLSGYAYMYAHYRLSKTTGKAARLHYLDDMAQTGKIYIGYIGPHLTSNGTT